MNTIYGKVAITLVDLENWRTDTQYEDSLISKLFLFQMVNNFSSFIYLAFIKSKVDGCPGGCMVFLTTNLVIIFTTKVVVGNTMEVLLPWLKTKMAMKANLKGVDGATADSLSQAEREYVLPQYRLTELVADFTELAVQFGYTTLFVTAFPLTPAMALGSNMLEVKSDALKMLNFYQRPIPQGAEDIGVWESCFQIIAALSVGSNAALMAFVTSSFSALPADQHVWLFITYQYIVFGIQTAMKAMIPDVPLDVEIQIQRTEFIVSKIYDRVMDSDDEGMARMKVDAANIIIHDVE
jgi:hypothetical protein